MIANSNHEQFDGNLLPVQLTGFEGDHETNPDQDAHSDPTGSTLEVSNIFRLLSDLLDERPGRRPCRTSPCDHVLVSP